MPDECEADCDCNGNGVPDSCDILAGTSADCNVNGTPDECESSLDCNTNGLRASGAPGRRGPAGRLANSAGTQTRIIEPVRNRLAPQTALEQKVAGVLPGRGWPDLCDTPVVKPTQGGFAPST